ARRSVGGSPAHACAGEPPTLRSVAMSLDLQLDYLPRLPRDKNLGIGCVGAGFIMRDCHLIAYRQAGFNPVAITSRNVEHARAVAEQHRIPRCHATLADLLKDPAVAVLDIAVP